MKRPVRIRICALMLLIATPSGAWSQTTSGAAARTSATSTSRTCADTAVDANLTRVTLYQHLWVRDTTAAIVAQVALLSQRIAEVARAALGGKSDTVLAAADSLGAWKDELKELPFMIVLHRDAPSSWYVNHAADTVDPKLTAFYARVLQSIPPDSLWIIWPEGEATDSVTFRIDVMRNYPHLGNAIRQSSFPIATAKSVQYVNAQVIHQATPHHPDDARLEGISARVLLRFVIDTNGRADPSSIQVIEPSPAVLDTSRFAHFYREFIDVSRDVVVRNRYAPAHYGACLVTARVQSALVYAGRRLTDR